MAGRQDKGLRGGVSGRIRKGEGPEGGKRGEKKV